jgi:lysozyme
VNDRDALIVSVVLVGAGAWWWLRRSGGDASAGAAFDAGGFLSSVDAAIESVSGQIVTTAGGLVSRLGGESMSISIAGLDAIKSHEALRLVKYRDQAGLWTIGYGHLIRPWENFDAGITEEKALGLLVADLAEAERAVNAGVRVPVSQSMYDAMVSLAFNIGSGAFASSSVLRRVNQGDLEGAASAFALWNKVTIDGALVVSNGLVSRRAAEAAMFRAGWA